MLGSAQGSGLYHSCGFQSTEEWAVYVLKNIVLIIPNQASPKLVLKLKSCTVPFPQKIDFPDSVNFFAAVEMQNEILSFLFF